MDKELREILVEASRLIDYYSRVDTTTSDYCNGCNEGVGHGPYCEVGKIQKRIKKYLSKDKK